MDIYSMMDEKSKKNLEKMMNDKSFSNAKHVKKQKTKQKRETPREDARVEHLEEYHFKTAEEFITHIKKRKRAYRGMGFGWITIDEKDPEMVVSYQRNEETGKMEFKYERFEAFKAYVNFLEIESSKNKGYLDFWHKKIVKKDNGDSDSDYNKYQK